MITGTHISRYRPFLLVLCILAFQLLFSIVRINEPFLDGRLHWYFGNAYFLLNARHSNYEPAVKVGRRHQDFLKIFGRGRYGYDDNGKVNQLKFHAHHPVLITTLFRLYTKIFGYGNWVPRSFNLILSLMTTLVLFYLLNAFIKKDCLSGILTFLYTLLPLNFMYMDQFINEIMAMLLLLSSFYFLAKASESKGCRFLFLGSLFFMLQTEWNLYFAVPCLIFYLFYKRNDPGLKGLYIQAGIVTILAVAVNLGILYQHGFDLDAITSVGKGRMEGGMEAVGLKIWLLRQASYLDMNFGYANLVLYLVGMTYIFIRGRRAANILLLGSLTFTFVGVCWVGIFKNLSLIHHFVQWSFGPAYILLLGGILADVSKGFLMSRHGKSIMIAIILPLLILTSWDSHQFFKSTRASTFGTISDIEAIKSLKNRLIVFSDGRSGPEGWWFSPVIEMAQDPIFQGTGRKGSVHSIETLKKLDPRTDVLVVLNSRKAIASFPEYCRKRFGINKYKLIKQSPSFSFFKMRKT